YFLTIPSAPQHVFSRARGTKCDLKWSKNPEKGLRGYRVYRLDGRFDDRPVSRLTPEPITGPTVTDETAGKAARRYPLGAGGGAGAGRAAVGAGVVRARVEGVLPTLHRRVAPVVTGVNASVCGESPDARAVAFDRREAECVLDGNPIEVR